MKVAVISDPHLGFSIHSKTENDSFECFREAIKSSLDCDIILLGGDLFDSRSPRTTVWARALDILSIPTLVESKNVKLLSTDKKLKDVSKRTLSHLPVVAIHGNHEIRSKNEINAIEALENAGLLVYLKRNKISFEKDGIVLNIYGMSYVPERFAKQFLDSWSPQPSPNGYNLLILHQNIDPFVYSPLDPPSLDISNLPKGFDIIIDGHIHIRHEEIINGTKFIIPGSLIPTQYQPGEANTQKGFYKLEFSDSSIRTEFVPLKCSRRFFYETIKIENHEDVELIERKIREILFQEYTKEPVIKIKILGRGDLVPDQHLRMIEKKYSSRAIILFSKSFDTPELTEKIEMLKSLKEQRLSLEEIGIRILKKNLDELGFSSTFDWSEVFKLLAEGETETALKILLGEQSTLGRFI